MKTNFLSFHEPLCFANGISLDLAFNGEQFLGIGEVRDGCIPLRSGILPWTFFCESESGIRFDEFRLLEVQYSPEVATLVFESRGKWQPRIQDADAMGDARIKTRRLRAPIATFQWRLRAIEEMIYENVGRGLAMQLEIETPGQPIHWVLEDATWELGGAARGCTLIQQDVSAIDLEQRVDANSEFSTIERFFTQESGGWGGSYPMDMLPRAAGASICDFAWKEDRALCLFAEMPGLTRARLEKFVDEDVIHYTDRAFFASTEHARTPERKLLVFKNEAPFKQHEARNLWLDCFMAVRSRIHLNYDFSLEIPRPCVTAHLWDDELKKRGVQWTEPLLNSLCTLRDSGFRNLFTHGVWNGVTGDDTRSDGNICHPYEFRFDEKFGGAVHMRQLVEAAREREIEIFQWFGFQFDAQSPVWKEHPEWVLREANGEPWDGGYGSLWCGRMASAFGDLVTRQIAELRETVGLGGIFWDSYQNLGVTCVDWQGESKAPQAEEIWRFQARLQRLGYTQRCEVVTIFGVSQVGMFGFQGDRFRRRSWDDCVDGDMAFALLDCSPGFFTHEPFSTEKLHPRYYFWLAAHRAIPTMNFDPWNAPGVLPGGELAAEYSRVNNLYNAALPRMVRPRLVEGGTYILWLDAHNRPSVVWTFEETDVQFEGAATNLCTRQKIECSGTLSASAGSVYCLDGLFSEPNFVDPPPTHRPSKCDPPSVSALRRGVISNV